MREDIQFEITRSVHPFNQLIQNATDVPSLTKQMCDNRYYLELIDVIDESGEEDFSAFNDLEMIYLYVHKKKDMNDKKNKKDNTKSEYIRDLLLFYQNLIEQAEEIELQLGDIGKYQLFKSLNHRHIRKYQEWLQTAPLGKGGKCYSVATLNRKMVIIKGLFSFLYDSDYIELPLHKKMQSSNVRSEDRPDKDLTSLEVSQIIEGFKKHPILHGLLAVLSTTGIRVNELCTARVCDLSYIGGEYWLKVMGKGEKPREVLIYPNVLETIKTFRNRRGLEWKIDKSDESPLFMTSEGKPYHYKYLSKLINKADVKKDIIHHYSKV